MNRFALQLLNAPALVLFAAIGLALQTSFFTSSILHYFKPDVVLTLVIWLALKRGFALGGVLTLILSNLAEIHSGVPQGILLISYMTVYLLLRLAARGLVIEGLSSYISVAACALILTRLVNLVALYFLRGGVTAAAAQSLKSLVPALIAETIFATWAFRRLDNFDALTYLKPGTEHGLEDEFHIPQEEGH